MAIGLIAQKNEVFSKKMTKTLVPNAMLKSGLRDYTKAIRVYKGLPKFCQGFWELNRQNTYFCSLMLSVLASRIFKANMVMTNGFLPKNHDISKLVTTGDLKELWEKQSQTPL